MTLFDSHHCWLYHHEISPTFVNLLAPMVSCKPYSPNFRSRGKAPAYVPWARPDRHVVHWKSFRVALDEKTMINNEQWSIHVILAKRIDIGISLWKHREYSNFNALDVTGLKCWPRKTGLKASQTVGQEVWNPAFNEESSPPQDQIIEAGHERGKLNNRPMIWAWFSLYCIPPIYGQCSLSGWKIICLKLDIKSLGLMQAETEWRSTWKCHFIPLKITLKECHIRDCGFRPIIPDWV